MASKEPRTDILVLVDVETTGIYPFEDLVLEVGAITVNLDLEIVSSFEIPVWGVLEEDRISREEPDSWIMKTHTENGLLDLCREQGSSLEAADALFEEWLVDSDAIGQPMCGSSILFDRQVFQNSLPRSEGQFHYRNIDVSSLKELCRRFNPRLYSRIGDPDGPQKKELHRVMPDLVDSLAELGWYLDNFLYWE